MNRPEPQHQYVDQTYAVAVGKMLRRAEHLQRRVPDDRRDVDWREVAYTLLLFSYLQSHLAEAATAIHDLWSAERFARGFRFGSDPSRGRHPLLKPLDAFTPQELVIETNLARGDLESIDRVLRAAYPDVAPTSVDGSAGVSGIAPEPSQRLLLRLSRDHQFLQRVAPLVHENCAKSRRRPATKATHASTDPSRRWPPEISSTRSATSEPISSPWPSWRITASSRRAQSDRLDDHGEPTDIFEPPESPDQLGQGKRVAIPRHCL